MQLQLHATRLSNLLSARSLLSHSIKDAARDGPCAHGKLRARPGRWHLFHVVTRRAAASRQQGLITALELDKLAWALVRANFQN